MQKNNLLSVLKRLFQAFLIVASLTLCGDVMADSEDSPRFDIKVHPALARYIDLLEHPPFLLLAMENNGVEISVSGKLLMLDESAAQLKNVTLGDVNIEPTLRFSHRDGSVFAYQAGIMDVSIPVNVDASSLVNGTLSIVFPKSGANVVLSKFSKAISEKIQMLANDALQQRMLTYLDEIASKKPKDRVEKDWIVTQVMLQGYNRRAFGEAGVTRNESATDWWFILFAGGIGVLIYLNRGWFVRGKGEVKA